MRSNFEPVVDGCQDNGADLAVRASAEVHSRVAGARHQCAGRERFALNLTSICF